MDSSSGKYVELLTTASQYSAGDFQRNSLQMLREECSFDMAMWGVVSFARDARTVYHSLALHDVPTEVHREFGSVAHIDGISDRVLCHPREEVAAFNLSRELPSPGHPEFLAYIRRFEFNNLLYVTRPHPKPGARHFIALWRRNDAAVYSPQEVGRSSELLRCALLAGTINETLSFKSTQTIRLDSGLLRARASSSGVLLAFDAGFVELLQQQWPQYLGPSLPVELMRCLLDGRRRRFMGRQLIASALIEGDTLYIVASANLRQVQLTSRQMEVACLVASGCSNKEIACRLTSSEKTIANHLSAIYERLGLNANVSAADLNRETWKRAALIRWWMEHPGGADSFHGAAPVNALKIVRENQG